MRVLKLVAPLLPLAWLVLAKGQGVSTRADDGTHADVSAASPRLVVTPPITYFADNCARCHGDEGAFYDKPALSKRPDAQLRQSLREMAEGPGNAPLGEGDIAVQMALHRAIAMERPFAAVTQWDKGVLQGEASAGSRVWLDVADVNFDGDIAGTAWKIAVPGNVDWSKATLHVLRRGLEASFFVHSDAYSGPVPAPVP